MLKIRFPDVTRKERGDADFTISNYDEFKKECLSKGFSLIKRKAIELIKLTDSKFKVRVYFSNPFLDKQLNLN
ncbi:hypothetical protein COU62_04600 [Candidatus Pacearchaeota archaeon CG10_big_fil_rev_8_21_14_0_10_35_219]|nr:hypothetical protein [Candidatus Pacearchaeota archaeon]OIO41866.1 MAG: hypothetical protein AUJ63_04930 [Candidatus Pacearchaeota archaeon CG1_02_35_32]PIO07271.1 MAG: hypothetical protein COU62_04600 [Candidatus Pacearchaeota archaeon CG10_big_fil_rev_8_21_14_0_10_35_219]PIY81162.1 MAG: hypothetical protein COY79_03915 [Candidatus Pacearchaeota archaeon CG_4_10_14_0_8_um_filter_35_169]PIZ80021.1 MAG: hypothetical protein COY00_02570 [Candidatus Pacearchaeota archaeon CG_4_10_14_0_2_um_filt